MLDINQLLNIGNESAGYENPKSLLDEMMEEIGFESDIDNAIYDADASAVTAASSIVENVYTVMAEREAGTESTSILEAYGSFGLAGSLVACIGQEAITDVIKRRAYSGLTQIKSLINTLISWVTKILGLSANTKKIFKSLAEKAKKIRKDLSKGRAAFSAKSVKNGEDKEFNREIPDYLGNDSLDSEFGIKTVIFMYTKAKTHLGKITDKIKFENGILIEGLVNADTNPISTSKKEEYAEKIKTWKEDTKNEESNDTLFSKITAGLDALVAAKSDKVDLQKVADKAKKHLEKIRKDMENANKSVNADLSKSHEYINEWITYTSLVAAHMNMFAKFYVKIADELFTDAKWLIMKAM